MKACLFSSIVISATLSESFTPVLNRYSGCQQSESTTPRNAPPLFASVADETGVVDSSVGDDSSRDSRTQKQLSNKTFNFNQNLNKLAESCSDRKACIVRQAQTCQAKYEAEKAKESPTIDTISFNTVLKAWAKVGNTLSSTDGRKHQRLLDPDLPIYTARHCAERAQELLKSEKTVTLDATSFNTVMDAWVKSNVRDATSYVEDVFQMLKDHKDLEPDSSSYTCLVDSYVRSMRPDRMEKIEILWQEVQSSDKVKTTSRFANCVINAYSQNIRDDHSYATKALEMLEEMKKLEDDDMTADATTYTTVMDTFSRLCNHASATKVEELFNELRELEQTTQNPIYKIKTRTYVTLLVAWARSKSVHAVEHAEKILAELIAHETNEPDSRAYTAVMSSWAHTRDPKKTTRAVQLLQEMKKASADNPEMHPSIYSYNTALECCTRLDVDEDEKIKAMKVAFVILKSLQADPEVQQDSGTFARLIKAVESALPRGEDRNTVASAAFEQAKQAGLVNKLVLNVFTSVVDSAVSMKVLSPMSDPKTGQLRYDDLPPEWCSKVPR